MKIHIDGLSQAKGGIIKKRSGPPFRFFLKGSVIMNSKGKTVGKTAALEEMVFIRCDKSGRELPPELLQGLNLSNSTIDRLVTLAAERQQAAQADGLAV